MPMLLIACSGDDAASLADDVSTRISSTPTVISGAANATKDPKTLRGTLTATGVEGWMDGDSVSIYRFSSMLHNVYTLSKGAGTPDAIFTLTKGEDKYESEETLYALTNEKYKYSFSPTFNSEPQLAVYVPFHLSLDEVGAPKGYSRMPLPYWATITFGPDGKLEGKFRGLTTLLRLDANELPPNTRAVVLTTSSFLLGSESYDEGECESLSGTYDCILGDNAKLKENEDGIFTTADTLRVNIGTEGVPESKRYLHIPVVSQNYTCLYIIAVKGDEKKRYRWQGEMIKKYENTTFEPNTVVNVEGIVTGIVPVMM